MQNTRLKNAFRIIFIISVLCVAAIGIYDYIIPDSISVYSDISDLEIIDEIDIPFVSTTLEAIPEDNRVSDGDNDELFHVSRLADTKMFGVLPLKKVNVEVYREITLRPGGMPFGVKLYTDGVIVAGITGVETRGGTKKPASDGGLKSGDIIKTINGKAVYTTDEVSTVIQNSGGQKLSFEISRNDSPMKLEITPVFSESENMYRAGIWLRDSTAGIGTVTFISPENNAFAGLGHGICDVDTGGLMPLRKGTVVDVTIKGITKGIMGNPGELKGSFMPGKIGSLVGNTSCGVYGILSDTSNLNLADPIKIGLKDELKTGPATIYCTVGDKTDQYTAEITKIVGKDSEQKNFIIKITDKRLLDATGGIVQGMSGSPIIQNGKLVGAVTHVLVNDPTRGYGIFIENMLKNMPEITE